MMSEFDKIAQWMDPAHIYSSMATHEEWLNWLRLGEVMALLIIYRVIVEERCYHLLGDVAQVINEKIGMN